MRREEKIFYYLGTVFFILVVLFVQATSIKAEPYGANNVTPINSTRYISTTTPKIAYAEAGNVTQLEINATSITRSWQGFYGNISGELTLADTQGNVFYNWNLTGASGEVYASRTNTVSWSTINCSNDTHIDLEQAYLGQSIVDPDSVNNTYYSTAHPTFLVGTRNMSLCRSTQAFDSTGGAGTGFWQVLLSDTNNQTVYTTMIDAVTQLGFDTRPWDFQLLVGENGQPGPNATAVTPYYIYVELA